MGKEGAVRETGVDDPGQLTNGSWLMQTRSSAMSEDKPKAHGR